MHVALILFLVDVAEHCYAEGQICISVILSIHVAIMQEEAIIF